MTTFQDFCDWAGTQRRAAELLGIDESYVSKILAGDRPLLPAHAIRAERASEGLYRCEAMLPDVHFVRDVNGIRWLAGEADKAA